ncbi:RNase H-like domain found in reverse transcriptase, partial [Popillia japonica]
VLLRDKVSWHWHKSQQDSFNKLKATIKNACILKHFNPKISSTITVDCSKDAIDMALLQDNQPCAYASKALTETQCSYSQIEKELLGILQACNKCTTLHHMWIPEWNQ